MPNEPALRLGAFAVVLIIMAGAEALAPRRRRARPRLGRWAANLSLTAVDTLVVRIVAPIGVTGVALYAHRHGYGLLPRLIHRPIAAREERIHRQVPGPVKGRERLSLCT